MPPYVSTPSVQLVTALVDAWNAHDVEAVVALHAADFEGEDVSEALPLRGHAGVRRSLRRYLNAFPDLHLTIDCLLAQETDVAVLWTVRGSHQGSLLHIPPTGRTVQIQGSTFLELAHGRVCRSRVVWDVAGLLRAVGLLPALQYES